MQIWSDPYTRPSERLKSTLIHALNEIAPPLMFFFLLFYHFYIYLHVYTLFVPHPFSLTLTPTGPTSRQNLFCSLVLWFCWRESIGGNKKYISFLLVWDKESYAERFLVLLPCTYVLQPTVVHPYQTSALLPGPLPIVASASLRLLIHSSTVNTSTTFKF
jgi:hypothetical protein